MADIVSHDIVSHAVDIEEVSPPACMGYRVASREGGGTFMFASLATPHWPDFLHGDWGEGGLPRMVLDFKNKIS